MSPVVLPNLPMPPSANHRMIPAHGRLIKAPDCRTYDKAIQIWMLRQKSGLFDNRRTIKTWIDTGFLLKVHADFYFPKEKVITKQGHPRRLDLDNRLKNLLDALGSIVDIDDKYIIEIHAHKLHWINAWEEVQVTLSPTHWRDTHD